MLERRMMARRGLIMIIVLGLKNVCGAVLGATIPISAVPLTASSAFGATTSTSTTVFAWCAVPGGLCNPYSLFPLFTLFYFFLFFSLSRLAAGRFFLRSSRVRSGQLLPFWEQFNLNCDG
jgi:hypothetical protein